MKRKGSGRGGQNFSEDTQRLAAMLVSAAFSHARRASLVLVRIP